MSFIAKLTADTDTQEDGEDFELALSDERRRLCAELATYRNELINGFGFPARKARCSWICLRLAAIDAQLADANED